MTVPADLQSMSMTLGELKGQMREIVHQLNNMSSKMDAIGHEVSKNSHLPDEVDKLKARVTVLEDKENQRVGAIGFGSMLLKSPLFGWLATAAVGLWAILSGKVGQ